jgi:hypothetical protein
MVARPSSWFFAQQLPPGTQDLRLHLGRGLKNTLIHGQDQGELTLPAGGVALFPQMAPLSDCECRAPLDAYCEGAECLTWDEAIAAAEEDGRQNAGDPSCVADIGQCDDVQWVRRSRGNGGYVNEYFDFSGELVAARVSSDTAEFCSNSSANVRHGPDVANGCLRTDDFCR